MRSLYFAIAVALPFALSPAPLFAQAAKETAKEPAKAAAKTATAKSAAPKLGPNQKQCRSKQPSGVIKTWTCGNDQPCCVSHAFNLYTCGSRLLQCL